MKRRHMIGILIITIVMIFSAVNFKSSLTPYVNFDQARRISGSVQVRGVLASKQLVTTDGGKAINFKLLDEKGEEVAIVYKGIKPDGLEQATSIVVIGKYQNNHFLAEKLLVKCPSKYQSVQGW